MRVDRTHGNYQNAFSEILGALGLQVFLILVVDILHEFELGVWKDLLKHLLRILLSLDKKLLHDVDQR